MRACSLVLLLAAPTVAAAWSHSGTAIAPDDLPLRWSVQADPQVPGMTSEQVIAELQATMAGWEAASCGLRTEFVGERDYPDPNQAPAGELHLVFAPLGSTGAAWVRLGPATQGEILYEREGRTYRREVLGPYAINTDYPITSDASVGAGECQGRFTLSLVVGTLVGQRLGLGPSFEPGSLMSTRPLPCAVVRPSEDDAEGLHALYGPWAQFACTSDDPRIELDDEVGGVVPFQVTCDIAADPRSVATSARWVWGDGGRSEGLPASHTYTAPGNRTLRATVTGEHATCGAFELDLERFGYVRACGAPEVAFTIERYRGLIFQTRNASNVQTFGCHTDVEWRAFDEDDQQVLSVRAWEPRLEFPEDGEYRVELEVAGPGGEATDAVILDTRRGSVRGYTLGNGCATVAAAGGGWFALALLLAVGRRRR